MAKQIATYLGGSSSLVLTNNNHCYAYSGPIAQAGQATEKTMLLFQTPKTLIKGSFDFAYGPLNDDNNATMIISFNSQQVYQQEQESSERKYSVPVVLIIPPLTEVKVTTQTTATSNPEMMVKFIGKVYNE